jgi:hypothetical protein
MTTTYRHKSELDAHEAGYKEALLDVYVVLTNNPLLADIEETHYKMIEALADQVAALMHAAAQVKAELAQGDSDTE